MKWPDDTEVPGTVNILDSGDAHAKKNDKGIVLLPQPTDLPNDPLNWSTSRKAWHFILLSFICALTAAVSNDASAAQESLNEIYGISYDSMNTGAGVLFLFIGWLCIFFAPASSLYGRRITYIICLLAGTLGLVWFATSTKTSDTIWLQAFVGMSEACAEAQVQQSLSDIFFQHQLGSVLTVYILATSVGTFLGPLIAHLISQAQTFRWVGWWGAIICGATLLVVIFACEETVFDRSEVEVSSEDSLVDKKDESTEVTTSVDTSKSYWSNIALITPSPYLEGYGFRQYITRFVVYFKVFTLPAVWISGLLWGLQDAYMSFFLTTQDTFFYDEPWGYSETGVAIMNVATLTGAVFGCYMSGIVSDKHVLWMAKRNNGVLEPEFRLYLLFITLVVSPLGLLLFGLGADHAWHPAAVYIGLGCIGFGWGSIGDTAMSYLMDAYPQIVIQGMVGVSIINNTLACVFTFTCSLWLDAAGTSNTYIALAVIDFVSIAFIVPTLKWGKTWRWRSAGLYRELVTLTQGMG